jgi:hypothetical protein
MIRKSTINILSLIITISHTDFADAFKLPDTGQTKCYRNVSPYDEIDCLGTGQDGAYNINPMSYYDNGNGMVTDNNTGLVWQKCSVGQNNDTICSGDGLKYNWYQAFGTYDATYNTSYQDVCGSLNLGGHTNWRLPTKKELVSIVDYSFQPQGATIKSAYFPNTYMDFYWSSTTDAIGQEHAWFLDFFDGHVFIHEKRAAAEYVRCVRGVQSSQSLVDNGNGTVTDKRTGLIWQQGEPGFIEWGSALSYCEGLPLGGHSDWRLPNVKELESLTDDTRYFPAIDTSFFPDAWPNNYCSSTTHTRNSAAVWSVNFTPYGVLDYLKVTSCLIRCVSAGQAGSSFNLTVHLSGSGMINNINPLGHDFSCFSASCTNSLDFNSPFTLHASPSTNFTFTGWSNGTGSASGCSGTGYCSFTLNATSTITANFDPVPLVKVLPSHPDIIYQTLQGAYNEATDNDQLKARNVVFSDASLTLNGSTNISLKGGLESDFTTVNGCSYLQGILSLVSGSLTVENICIK